MTPKILKGRSFKGAAAYLLHDVADHETSNRVVWTMTRNLATQKPDTAWRVMAATALDAPRLKKEARIKNTGRKQQFTVKHLVLSWHPEEKDTLTREDMEAAIEGALAAIKATERQALIIAHNDTAHPHVHILINRTLENGTLLDDSKEYENLQDWALTYQRQRNQTYCPERELNAAAKKRREPTNYEKIPRQIVDADKVLRRAANDNPDRRTALKAKHLEQARAQAARGHALKKRHSEAWKALEEQHVARRRAIGENARKGQAAAKRMIIETFRPEWRTLKLEQAEEARAFAEREKSTFGRMSNLFRNIDIGRSALEGDRPSILSQLWRGVQSSDARKAMLDKAHARAGQALETRQRKAIRAAMLPVLTQKQLQTRAASLEYNHARADLIFVQMGERAKLRVEWQQLVNQRATDYAELRASLERTEAFNQKAAPKSLFDQIRDQLKSQPDQTPAREQNNDRDQERD